MRVAPRFVAMGVLAAVLAATAAGCNPNPYGSRGYDYGPSFDKVPGYQPGSSSGSSTWDYYRNYRGNLHPGPETP